MRRRTNNAKGNNKKAGRRQRVPRNIPSIPKEITVTMRHVSTFKLSGASSSITKRFASNSVYRPEVSGGNAAAPFLEYQSLFAFFRVISYHYKVSWSNLEAFSVSTFAINSTEDPSVSATILNAVGDLSQTRDLSAKGGMDRASVQRGYRVQEIVGRKAQVMSADNYQGTMTAGFEANPQDVTWLGIGATSISGSNLTNGVEVIVYIDYVVKLYSRHLLYQGEQP